MKRLFFYCFLIGILSCSDGDLQIEAIDFDAVAIQDCGNVGVSKANVLFKINEDEALILTLPNGALKNEAGEVTSAVPGASKITYRIFSANVSKNYFCNEVPLTDPVVMEEIEAEGGQVIITTTTTDDITFTHEIALSGISFVTSTNSRITDLRINDYGTLTTKVE